MFSQTRKGKHYANRKSEKITADISIFKLTKDTIFKEEKMSILIFRLQKKKILLFPRKELENRLSIEPCQLKRFESANEVLVKRDCALSSESSFTAPKLKVRK